MNVGCAPEEGGEGEKGRNIKVKKGQWLNKVERRIRKE